jgi:hypothetical protein
MSGGTVAISLNRSSGATAPGTHFMVTISSTEAPVLHFGSHTVYPSSVVVEM